VRNAYAKLLLGKLERTGHLGYLGTDGVMKYDVNVSSGLNWLKTGFSRLRGFVDTAINIR
jgi:hypothetical protein